MADKAFAMAPDVAGSLLRALGSRAGRQLDRLDHWPLEGWAGAPGLCFAGTDESGWAGILLVPVDTGGPPAWQARAGGPAWVRWIGVDDRAPLGPRLRALLRAAFQVGRACGVSSLWLLSDSAGWLDPYLRDEGYRSVDEVITLERTAGPGRPAATTVSPGPGNADGRLARLRAAQPEDMPAVAMLDGGAFRDPWRYTEATLAREFALASVARVALAGDRIIGYTTAVVREGGGHINRIAVDPKEQGRGVGKLLLADMSAEFAQRGVTRATLNTQRSNLVSQRLYRASGFRVTGPALSVYHLPLA